MAPRAASAVFVGRSPEIAALRDALADPRRTTAVLVGGEAGAGKSRLVAEFTTRAARDGCRVLSGACVALGAESLPYAPFVGVLTQMAAEEGADRVEALVGPGRVELARLVPELRRPGDDHRPSEAADRAVLFQVVMRALEALGSKTPLVLVVEDLHWADASSRELLAFLMGRLRGGVLVVATYRNDEIHRRHPLRPFLAEAARSERVMRLDLPPLTPAEVTRQLEAIAGSTVSCEVIKAVTARAEGNPFFAEELLAAGGGEELPPDLAEVLAARLSALPEPAQELVAVAAVGGPRVAHDLLAVVAAGAGIDFDAGLRDAVARNILIADPARSYSFRHALLQEAAYAELLAPDRVTLHGAYAGALDGHPEWASTPSGVAGELAYHYLAAGDRMRGLGASVAAADAAMQASAFTEAHALYEQALQLWDQSCEGGTLDGCDQVDLLQRAADAAVLAGASERAVVLMGSALEHLDPVEDRTRAALAHQRLARLLSMRREGEGALAANRAAVALMPAAPSAEKARILAGNALTLMWAGRYQESRIQAEAAVEVARAVGARREEGDALNTLGVDFGRLGHFDKAVGMLEEALAIAEAVGSIEDMRRAYNNLGAILDESGQPERGVAANLDGAARLLALGYEDGAVHLRAGAAMVVVDYGSWDDAWHLATGVLETGAGDSSTAWRAHLTAGTVALRRGEFASAHTHLAEARRLIAKSVDADDHAFTGVAQAELALAEGQLDQALVWVDGSLGALGATDAQDSVRKLVVLGLRAEADAVRQGGARGDAERVTAARQRAEALMNRVRNMDSGPGEVALQYTPQGRALQWQCEAEWGRLTGENPPENWSLVAEAWLRLSRPYEAAYAHYRQAQAAFLAGAKDAGTAALREAFSEASRLGAAPLVGDIEALARRARVRTTITQPVASTDASMSLTARETDVLSLVAAGRTNREIAGALFMSEKTASVHVSRILTKLGVANRGQAAAIAFRLGLVDDRP